MDLLRVLAGLLLGSSIILASASPDAVIDAGTISDLSWRRAIPGLDPTVEVPELMAISRSNNYLHHNHGHDHPDRLLSESNDYQYENHFIDKDGNEYDPYSLAWRYLGLYMDCADDQQNNGGNNNDRRGLSGDDGGSCPRVLLWAAYHDPRYRGGAIGEYQFFDLDTRSWDASSCTSSRCAKMDCHEPHTHFKLVGVFKETDGMYDWTEQLFKHEGYCIWNDEDVYEEMEDWMGRWPTTCTELNSPDDDGNTLYLHTLPLAGGNMTFGIFTDEDCTTISSSVSLSDYILLYYYAYYGNNEKGREVAETYEAAIEAWNLKMSTFKVCQPCVAYNLGQTSSNRRNGRRAQNRKRHLGDNENDGDGEEQSHYNCYDDAGYTNVNQCYKFETKTTLGVAERADLIMASEQGTILEVRAFGRTYGSGGYRTPLNRKAVLTVVALVYVGCAMFFFLHHWYTKRHREVKKLPETLKETLDVGMDDATINNDEDEEGGDTEGEVRRVSRIKCEKEDEEIPAMAYMGGEYDVPVALTPNSTSCASLHVTPAASVDQLEIKPRDKASEANNKEEQYLPPAPRFVPSLGISAAAAVKATASSVGGEENEPKVLSPTPAPASSTPPSDDDNTDYDMSAPIKNHERVVQDNASRIRAENSSQSPFRPPERPSSFVLNSNEADNEHDLTQYGIDARVSPSGKFTILHNPQGRFRDWINK